MKNVLRAMLLVLLTGVTLIGCADPNAMMFLNMAAQTGVSQAVRSKQQGVSTSDADLTKMTLASPMTTDVFVNKTKKAILNLGYQVSQIVPTGNGVMVMATKQVTNMGFFGIGRNFSYTRVTLTLGQDGQTVNISVSMTGNGSGDEKSTAQIVNDFRDQLTT